MRVFEDRLGQHSCRRASITRLQMHPPDKVTRQHRAHIFSAIRQRKNAAGNRRRVCQHLGLGARLVLR